MIEEMSRSQQHVVKGRGHRLSKRIFLAKMLIAAKMMKLGTRWYVNTMAFRAYIPLFGYVLGHFLCLMLE